MGNDQDITSGANLNITVTLDPATWEDLAMQTTSDEPLPGIERYSMALSGLRLKGLSSQYWLGNTPSHVLDKLCNRKTAPGEDGRLSSAQISALVQHWQESFTALPMTGKDYSVPDNVLQWYAKAVQRDYPGAALSGEPVTQQHLWADLAAEDVSIGGNFHPGDLAETRAILRKSELDPQLGVGSDGQIGWLVLQDDGNGGSTFDDAWAREEVPVSP